MPVQLPVERAYAQIRGAIAANVGWDHALEPDIREALSGLERAYTMRSPRLVDTRLLVWIRDHDGLAATQRQIAEEIHSCREVVTRRLMALCGDGTVERCPESATGAKGLPRWSYKLSRDRVAA